MIRLTPRDEAIIEFLNEVKVADYAISSLIVN